MFEVRLLWIPARLPAPATARAALTIHYPTSHPFGAHSVPVGCWRHHWTPPQAGFRLRRIDTIERELGAADVTQVGIRQANTVQHIKRFHGDKSVGRPPRELPLSGRGPCGLQRPYDSPCKATARRVRPFSAQGEYISAGQYVTMRRACPMNSNAAGHGPNLLTRGQGVSTRVSAQI